MNTFTLQAVIIDALASGRKLFEILKEPGMPPKADIDYWNRDPDFLRRFNAACDEGRRKRDDGAVDFSKPAVLRGNRQPRLATQPIGDFVARKPSHSTKPVMHVVKEEPAITPAPGRKELVLQLVESGRNSRQVLEEHRVSTNTLALWRKDPDFLARWKAVVKVGGKRPSTRKTVEKPQPTGHVGTPRTRPADAPHLYLQPPRHNSTHRLIKYNRQVEGNRVHFSTGIEVDPLHWDNVLGMVTDTHPDAANLRRQLLAINDLANEAMREGKTEEEIRALLDVPPATPRATRTITPYERTPRAYIHESPAPVAGESTPLSIPPAMPEETTPQPEAVIPAYPTEPAHRKYMAGDRTFDDSRQAAAYAWELAVLSEHPVSIYEIRTTQIGVVNANAQAA